jgi:hypothetical protein
VEIEVDRIVYVIARDKKREKERKTELERERERERETQNYFHRTSGIPGAQVKQRLFPIVSKSVFLSQI